jgi:hypothetical protein
VLVFQRGKERARQSRVIFVNGENEQVRGNKLSVLSRQNVVRLIDATRRFKNERGFCRVVTLGELRLNEFNLSISRYVQVENSPERDDTGVSAAHSTKVCRGNFGHASASGARCCSHCGRAPRQRRAVAPPRAAGRWAGARRPTSRWCRRSNGQAFGGQTVRV